MTEDRVMRRLLEMDSEVRRGRQVVGAKYPLRFDGPEYQPERDQKRLSGQCLRIFDLMGDGIWRTLAEIEAGTGAPQPSVSAQLRHLRKERFGGHTVNRRCLGQGLFEYQLIPKGGNDGMATD